jgi:L-asparagine transporter-like permease
MAPRGNLLDGTLRGDTAQCAALAATGREFFAAAALYLARSIPTSRFAVLLDPHATVVAVTVWIFITICAVTLGEQASAQVEDRSARVIMTRTTAAPLSRDGAPSR